MTRLDKMIGRTIGGYRIIEQIGGGGASTVYKAYQPGLDRYVALKVLSPYHADNRISRADSRVKRALWRAASPQHPAALRLR